MSLLTEERLGISGAVGQKAELRPNWSEDDLQLIFRAAYEQVFGREGVYGRDMFTSAEALLRNGKIDVRQFVEFLAKSEFYKERFFYNNSQVRFIELNYKHLLGRAIYDRSEIAYHVDLYASQGYDVEIDSYIYSREYSSTFGNYTVPYHRGFKSIPGMKTVGFNRMFAVYRGNGNSDNAQFERRNSRLQTRVSKNLANTIIPPSSPTRAMSLGGGRQLYVSPVQEDSRLYLVEVLVGGVGTRVAVRSSRRVYTVSFDKLSQRFQEIHRQGGKIVNVQPA